MVSRSEYVRVRVGDQRIREKGDCVRVHRRFSLTQWLSTENRVESTDQIVRCSQRKMTGLRQPGIQFNEERFTVGVNHKIQAAETREPQSFYEFRKR